MSRWAPLATVERVKNLIAGVLALGLGSAVLIFASVQSPEANPLGYEFKDSKAYLRNMEMFGGKANLLTAEFREWLQSLFHGKPLAYTVAVLTLVLAGGLWLFAMPLPPEPPAE